jgi:hypothetical protein
VWGSPWGEAPRIRKDAWPQRYGLVGGSVPRGFFRQLLAPFKRDAA